MLYTDPQKQQQTQEENALHGGAMNLEVGYKELYAAWSIENAAALPLLSPENRAQSFSDYVEKNMVERECALIEEQEKDPTRRKEKLAQAQRGDLLLVSTDQGQHFDKVLTVEEVQKEELGTVRLLSSSLRSTTPNFTEAKEEQNLLHVVAKLREQHFLVNNAEVKNHQVLVEVTHPIRGNYQVQVELAQDKILPFVYEFINEQGSKKVSEGQLPEEFGVAEGEHIVQRDELEEKMRLHLLQTEEKNKGPDAGQLEQAALATAMPFLFKKNMAPVAALLKAKNFAEDTRMQMQTPVIHQDNVAVKAAVKAHKARQEKSMKEEAEHYSERQKKYEVASKLAYQKSLEEEQQKKEKTKSMAAKARESFALKAGAASGLFASAGSLAFLFIHSSHT